MAQGAGLTRRAVALIDGDHHPQAVREALAACACTHGLELVGAVFGGGEEKLPADADLATLYGLPVLSGDTAAALAHAVGHTGAQVVLDLADEPSVGPARKLELACHALAAGAGWLGAGFTLSAPQRAEPPLRPALAVIGTGKRTGKTAIAGHWAALLREAGARPAIVAMGRGGPAEPQVARPGTALAELLAIARSGGHAASDYLEDAVLAGVPAVGARRVGGGLAGATMLDRVHEAAQAAAGLGAGCLIYEGSGASLPGVAADRTVCVVGSREGALTALGPVRLLLADLLLVTGEEPGLAEDAARWCRGPAIEVRLRPEPAEPVPGDARIAFFSTGPGELHGIEPVVTSRALARRGELIADLERAAAERCEVYLTELKAAAVDTVAEAAERAGARVVFVRNRPHAVDGRDLDAELLGLYNSIA